jgi:hypothetical protein
MGEVDILVPVQAEPAAAGGASVNAVIQPRFVGFVQRNP